MRIQFIVGVLIILLATCSVRETASAESGVEGQVFIRSMCPVIQAGQECPNQFYHATLTVNSPDRRTIVQVQTDAQGHFKIPLQPGNYILHPESSNSMPFAAEQSFSVAGGQFTQVVVNYDSGVR